MFLNGKILLVTTTFNIKFISIMNMQGYGATKAANSINTTILLFTAHQINIEIVVVNNKFEEEHKSLRPVHF